VHWQASAGKINPMHLPETAMPSSLARPLAGHTHRAPGSQSLRSRAGLPRSRDPHATPAAGPGRKECLHIDFRPLFFSAQRRPASSSASMQDHIAEVERINAINRMRMQQMQTPGMPGQPAPGMPVNPYAPTIPNHTGQYQPPNPYSPSHPGAGSP